MTVGCDDVGSLLSAGTEALTRHGDARSGRRYFEKAFGVAERSGDGPAMALAVLGLSELSLHEYRSQVGSALLRSRLYRALSTVDGGSTLALRLRVRLAAEADHRRGGSGTILGLLDEARAVRDPLARADALNLAHGCLIGPDHRDLRQSLATELIAESFRTGRRSDLLLGLLWHTVDLLLDGHPHAQRYLTELREQLTNEDHGTVGFVAAAIGVMLAIRAGDLDRAEELAHACARRGEARGDANATAWHAAHLVTIRWYQGRLPEVLPVLYRLVGSPELSDTDDSTLAALAVAAAMVGDRRRAQSALAALCGRDLEDLPHSGSWLVTMYGIVEAADRLGDAGTAARAYALLQPYADRPMTGGPAVACFGSVHHALGVAAATTGDLDGAVEHLRTAIGRNLALAHWPAVAASRRRLAQVLARRHAPSDDAEATRQLAAAAGDTADDTAGPETPARPAVASCVRHGRRWRVTWGARAVVVESRVGMLYLAVLLADPGGQVDAVDFVAGRAALDGTPGSGLGAERARIAVGKAIRRAIEHIGEAEAGIGEHLRRTVTCGARCAYLPG